MKEELSHRVSSVSEAQVIGREDDRHGKLQRAFTPRQIHMISLGSAVGSGLFISSGQALALGGPGNMLIAYTLVCSCVWAVLNTLCEMVIAFPVSGNFIDYADRWVDRSLAFGAGFAEWLGYTANMAAEASFFDILVQYWAQGRLPLAASLTIYLVIMAILFSCPLWVFGWFEYISSMIKIVLFLLLFVLCLALIGGAGPTGSVHRGETWTDLPAFKNGFSGFAKCALLAVWAFGDQIVVSTMAGEAQTPRYSLGHAAKLVPYRASFIFISAIALISMLVPSTDPRLLGGSSLTASPFVIAQNDAGIPVMPHIMNAGILVGVLGNGAETFYTASRILRTMSHQALIPEFFAKVDGLGRPTVALLTTGAVAIPLTYIKLSSGGAEALTWLMSLTSASFFLNWLIVAFISFRFRRALKVQKDPLLSEPYAWRSTAWPLAPAWLGLVSLFLLACCITVGLKPPGGTQLSTVESFFQYMIGAFLILGGIIGYKIIYRTSWRDLSKADHVTGRHTLTSEEIDSLDRYYSLPRWRRFVTYVQLW